MRHNTVKKSPFDIDNFLLTNDKRAYIEKVEKIEPFDWRLIIPMFKDEELMEAIIEKITDVNYPNFIGINLIHYVVKYGTVKMLEALIRRGADINRRDVYRIQPIDYAVCAVRLDMISIFVDHDVEHGEIKYTIEGLLEKFNSI